MSPAYQFAFRFLPSLCFSDPCATRRALLQPGFIETLWTHLGVHRQEFGTQPPRLETFGEVLLVRMPPPSQSPEAYFVAMVGEEARLYTLELGDDLENDEPCTFFCACTPSGHANYGKGPKPEVAAFLAALAGFR
jgi:hypothetical protein